jgi:hypothetical protein
MPQFDSNLLLLMGISSGAYIGFKVAKPRATTEQAGPPEDDQLDTGQKPT